MSDDELHEVDLATWIEALRLSLLKAEQAVIDKAKVSGVTPSMLFQLAEVRLDLEVKTDQKSKGIAQIGPNWMEFKVLTGTLEHERTRSRTQKISLVLRPIGPGAMLGKDELGGVVVSPDSKSVVDQIRQHNQEASANVIGGQESKADRPKEG